jgi:hypothetical protein
MSRPGALAVLRLMTSCSLVGHIFRLPTETVSEAATLFNTAEAEALAVIERPTTARSSDC